MKELKRQLLALPPKTRCSACRAPMPASHDTPAYMPVCNDCYASALGRFQKRSKAVVPVGEWSDWSDYGFLPDGLIKTNVVAALKRHT